MLKFCKFVSCVSGMGAGSGETRLGWAVLTPPSWPEPCRAGLG